MVHQNVSGRGVQTPIPHKRVEDGSADRAILRCGAGGRPEFFQGFPRFGWAASRYALSESDRVHPAGAGAADCLDANSIVLEELVENTPGEGTVGAAALQGELDLLFSLCLHPTSPDPGSAARAERRGVGTLAVLSTV